MNTQMTQIIAEYESAFSIPKTLRKKLDKVMGRENPQGIASGLTLLALKAFPGSPLQKLLQRLREETLKP